MSMRWLIISTARSAVSGGVTRVNWACVHVVDTWEFNKTGTCNLEPNPVDEKFIKFEDLLENQLIEWVHGQVDKDGIEEELKAHMQKRLNPTTIIESWTGEGAGEVIDGD